MNKYMKVISYILAVTILSTILPYNLRPTYAEPINESYTRVSSDTSAGVNDTESTPVGEDIEKRGKFVKHFLKENNTYEAVVYPEAVHYLEDGKWKDIDNTLIDTKDEKSNNVLENKDNSYKVNIAKSADSKQLIKIKSDKHELSWGFQNARKSNASVLNTKNSLFKSIDEKMKRLALPNLESSVLFPDMMSFVDVRYDVKPEQLKEIIILKQKIENPQFNIELEVKNLHPMLEQNNSIVFYDDNDATRPVFKMQAPVMMDANDEQSESIAIALTEDKGKYILSMQPDNEWLSSPDRQYPVNIDPTISTPLDPGSIHDTFVSQGSPNSNFQLENNLKVGLGKTTGVKRTYIHIDLPTLSTADMVVNADLYLYNAYTNIGLYQTDVHKVLSNWNSSTITWNAQPGYDSNVVSDYQLIQNSGTYNWDITTMVKGWYTEGNNYGLMLRTKDETDSGYSEFYSSDAGAEFEDVYPRIIIGYIDCAGLENYWTYHAQDAGRAGTAYINDYNGNLVFTRNDISMGGNRMPIQINHVFQSDDRNLSIGYGSGWRLNLSQTVVPKTINKIQYYVYTDEDGTRHYFKEDTAGIYKDESGASLTLTKNTDGSYVIKDKEENKLNFNAQSYLTSITDSNGNTQAITYNAAQQISSVNDASGRTVNFTYENNLLSKITDPAGRITEFVYSNGRLIEITDPDTKTSSYSYDDNRNLVYAQNYDGYRVGLEYETANIKRVKVIKEYHHNASTGIQTLGNQLEMSYGYNTMTFKDVNGNKNIYQFNNSGNTINIRDNQGYAKYFDYGTGSNINKLNLDSKLQKASMNLLRNHNAEVLNDGWTLGGWSGSIGTGTFDNTQSYFGNTSLKVEKTNAAARHFYYQAVTVEKGETYTLSSYVKRNNITNNNGKGAFLLVNVKDNANNTVYTESQNVSGTAEWERIEVKFSVPGDSASNTVYVAAGITEETGVAYFDALQLEKGSIANRYNLVENADFAYGLTYWTKGSGTDTNDTVVTQADETNPAGLDTNRMRMNGNAAARKLISQEVKVSGNKGDVFVIGGWGKGQSVPLIYPRWFAIDLQFNYKNGGQFWYTFNFNEDSTQWQYASTRAIAKEDYGSVTVIFRYYLNENTAYFDGFQLFKEEFGQSYTYDSNGNIISSVDLDQKESRFEYNPANDLIRAADPRGSNFKYTYNEKHNIKTASSGEKVLYSFNYDEYGNPTESRTGELNNKYSDANNWLNGNKFFSMDVNGDGRDDLVTRDSDGTWSLWRSNNERLEDLGRMSTTGYSDANGYAANNRFFIMDINGDGKEDLVARNSWGGFEISLSDGEKFVHSQDSGISALNDANGGLGSNRIFIMDINGDNKDDLVARSASGKFTVYLSNGTGLAEATSKDIPGFSDSTIYSGTNRFFVMDINGDDKDDLAARDEWGGFQVWLSDGANIVFSNYKSTNPALLDTDGWLSGNRFLVADINGDNKDDLLARYAWGEFAVYLSDGVNIVRSGSFAENDYKDEYGWLNGNRFLVMDIDGDNKEDMVTRYGNGTLTYHKSNGSVLVRVGSLFNPNNITASAIYTTSGNYSKTLTDPSGNTVTNNYDESKDVLNSVTDAKGNTISYTYDNLDRLTNVSKTVDGNHAAAEYSYENDRLKTVTHNGFSYIFGYDPLGNNTSVSVGNQTLVTNTHAQRTGLLLESTYGNGQKVGNDYDSLYRVTAKKENGQARYKYEYDSAGNLGYQEDLVNGVGFRYIYDLANRLTQVKDSLGNILKYEFDVNNNVSKVTEKINGADYITSYTYDKDNKPLTVTYGTNSKTNSYDTLGRLQSILLKTGAAQYSTRFTYEPGANGSTTTKVQTIDNNGGAISYTYEANGNIETIKQNGNQVKYYYNELNEVTREDNQVLNKTVVYAYDVGGNIVSRTEYPYTTGALGTATKVYSYIYGDTNWKDKLTSYDGRAIGYDALGNVTSYNGVTYSWGMGRQLAGLSAPGYNVSFKYNDIGIRTEKTYNGVTTKYTLEGDKVIYETDGTDRIHYTYDSEGNLVSMNLNDVEYYYIRNSQGDIIGLLDRNGAQVVSYTYETYGKNVNITGTLGSTVGVKNPYRYRGYRLDSETGLYYLNSRYYNPNWGRYISADTYGGQAGKLLSHNVFAYCANNPVMNSDPSGKWFETLLDIVSVVVSAVEFIAKPSWQTFGYLAWDVAAAVVPFVPGSYVAKTAKVASKAYKAVKKADTAKDVSKAVSKVAKVTRNVRKTDFYVTPKADIIPATREGFNNNLSKMINQNGKYIGESSYGPVRVRVEDAHLKKASTPAHQNPDHDVAHIHVEHRRNGPTGPFGEGDPSNKTTFPQIWLR